jgi:hypothetical protein
MIRMAQQSRNYRAWRFRIPWLVVGVIVGTLCMKAWPGQTKSVGLLEMAKWLGGGLVAGVAVDYLTRVYRVQSTTRTLLWLVTATALFVALATGEGVAIAVVSLGICGIILFSLMGGWMERRRSGLAIVDSNEADTVTAISDSLASIQNGEGIPLEEAVKALREKHRIPEDP